MRRTPGRLFLPLDVEFMDDDKVVDAGEKAGWMYVAMCLRSKRLMSDGFLTVGQVSRLHVTAQAPRLAALLRVGLIEEVDGGYLVCAFSKRNPLAAAINEKAERKAAGAALGNHNRWHVARGITDSLCDHCTDTGASRTTDTGAIGTESVSESTETEAETETVASDSQQRPTPKHKIPEDWQPSSEDLTWASSEAPLVNAERETENFRDYWLDKGERRPGWSRTWKRWMRRAQENAESRPPQLRAVGQRFDWQALGRQGVWDQ